MAIFQIVDGRCHWQTPFKSLDEVKDRFPPDCVFVDAPDYVNEQWGFDETEIGDARFIKPVPPEGWIYDDETGQMMPEDMLVEALAQSKDAKQDENNNVFAKWLTDHPITWTDGKQYGVTLQDQNEISLNLMSYQMAVQTAQQYGTEDPTTLFKLEWHAINEACVPWTYENLVALSIAIRAHIYDAYTLNQTYKTQIYACETRTEVNAIVLDYSVLNPKFFYATIDVTDNATVALTDITNPDGIKVKDYIVDTNNEVYRVVSIGDGSVTVGTVQSDVTPPEKTEEDAAEDVVEEDTPTEETT